MPSKSQLVYAALVAVVLGQNLRIRTVRNRATQSANLANLYSAAIEAYENTERRQNAFIDYLCDLLEKHDIEADEFDMIALRYYAS